MLYLWPLGLETWENKLKQTEKPATNDYSYMYAFQVDERSIAMTSSLLAFQDAESIKSLSTLLLAYYQNTILIKI